MLTTEETQINFSFRKGLDHCCAQAFNYIYIYILQWNDVHRCGPGGSMRACHAAGPGSIPGREKFPG